MYNTHDLCDLWPAIEPSPNQGRDSEKCDQEVGQQINIWVIRRVRPMRYLTGYKFASGGVALSHMQSVDPHNFVPVASAFFFPLHFLLPQRTKISSWLRQRHSSYHVSLDVISTPLHHQQKRI